METTEIDGRTVPIDQGPRTFISFSMGSGGRSEAGTWEFWACEGPRGRVVSRCRPGADPGKRVREIETSPADEERATWPYVRETERLRPARADEVARWLNMDGHRNDRPNDGPHEVEGKNVRVRGQHGGYMIGERT